MRTKQLTREEIDILARAEFLSAHPEAKWEELKEWERGVWRDEVLIEEYGEK